MVQIIAVQGGHGQDRPGIYIHGDRAGAVLDIVIRHSLFEMFFNKKLDRRIQCQNQIKAIFPGLIGLEGGKEQIASVSVGGAQAPPGAAGERGIVFRLDPLQAVVIGTYEADHMAGQGGIGIIASGIRLQTDAAEIILRFQGADKVSLFFFQLARHRHIPGAAAGCLLSDLFRIQLEDIPQLPGDQLLILAVHLDLRRAQIDVVHRGADGQRIEIGVVDRAAGGGARRFAQLLSDRQAFVALMLQDLKLKEPRCQHGKHKDAEKRHQKQYSPQHLPVWSRQCSPCSHSAAPIIPE